MGCSCNKGANKFAEVLNHGKDLFQKNIDLCSKLIDENNKKFGTSFEIDSFKEDMIKIGVAMASVDGTISDSEIDYIAAILSMDASAVKAYADFAVGFMDKPSDFYLALLENDKKNNATLAEKYRNALKLFSTIMCLPDGTIGQEEEKKAAEYILMLYSTK